MPKKKRNYKREYELYHGKPEQIRRRTKRNAARRKLEKEGKVHKGDGKDVDHKDRRGLSNKSGNLRVKSASSNRSYSRKGKGSKKYGKRYAK